MTVNTMNNTVVYAGNNATDEFDFSFRVMEADHLIVARRSISTGLVDKIYEQDEYTIDGLNEDAGSITLVDGPLSSSYEIVIQRIVPITQELDIVNQGGFYPETVEDQLDRTIMMIQQLDDTLGRTIRVAMGEEGGELPEASVRAGNLLIFDEDGGPDVASVSSITTLILAALDQAGAVTTPTLYLDARALGVPFDSDFDTGGGTDATVAMQALLDVLRLPGQHLHIRGDGCALVGALDISSDTTLEGFDFYLADGTNTRLLGNANMIGSGAVTDERIRLINCRFNGNAANQTGIGLYDRREADGTLIGLLQFYGVADLKIKGCTAKNSKSIAVHLSNFYNVVIDDIYIDNNTPPEVQQGGIQFEGPGSVVYVHNVRGNGQDDLIALSSDGGSYDEIEFVGLGPNVSVGPITDVLIRGVIGLGDCLSGVRLFNSVSRIDRVVIDGITGTFRGAVFWNDPAGLTPGNVGTVSLSNVNVQMVAYSGFAVLGLPSGISLYGVIDHFIMNNITFNEMPDNRGALFIDGTCDIKRLQVDGLTVNDTIDRASVSIVHLHTNSRVRRAEFRNVGWRRLSAHARAAQVFFAATGVIVDDFFVDGVYANRVDNILFKDNTTTWPSVRMKNVEHHEAPALGGAVAQSGGTISLVDLSGWARNGGGRRLNNVGTITAREGDAFTTWTAAVLVAGTVTVAYPDTTAATMVFVNRRTDGGTVAASYSVTRNPGVGFTITAKDGSGATITTDTSTVAIEIRDV